MPASVAAGEGLGTQTLGNCAVDQFLAVVPHERPALFASSALCGERTVPANSSTRHVLTRRTPLVKTAWIQELAGGTRVNVLLLVIREVRSRKDPQMVNFQATSATRPFALAQRQSCRLRPLSSRALHPTAMTLHRSLRSLSGTEVVQRNLSGGKSRPAPRISLDPRARRSSSGARSLTLAFEWLLVPSGPITPQDPVSYQQLCHPSINRFLGFHQNGEEAVTVAGNR